MQKIFYIWLISGILLIAGCASVGKITNTPVDQLPAGAQRYVVSKPLGDILFLLAFSGGGTRAAAMSYGVLEELKGVQYQKQEREVLLLDEVDEISSVSGGSFTSAYYGLFGDQIFNDFKEVFLYRDVQGELRGQVFGFFQLLGRMFTTTSRSEVAIDYYDKHIFRGKTFADLNATGGPIILINASDLNSQNQFVFVQPQFDFLCSDISQIKIARAVAASSAVPLVFAPILFKKYTSCDFQKPLWLTKAEARAAKENNIRLQGSIDALNYYLDKNNPPYVTLLDGGITDNLGLRTLYRKVSLLGGAEKVHESYNNGRRIPDKIVLIVVNASTSSTTDIGKSADLPSLEDTLNVVTDIQLHSYNTETNALLKERLQQWAESISTAEKPVTPFLIELDVSKINDPDEKRHFNSIRTSFSLEKEQVDRSINTSRRLLREHPEYHKLLQQLGAYSVKN